jgi:hypothetical protein
MSAVAGVPSVALTPAVVSIPALPLLVRDVSSMCDVPSKSHVASVSFDCYHPCFAIISAFCLSVCFPDSAVAGVPSVANTPAVANTLLLLYSESERTQTPTQEKVG